jgi:hypothetical protein
MIKKLMESPKALTAVAGSLYVLYAGYCLALQMTNHFSSVLNYWVNVFCAVLYCICAAVAWYYSRRVEIPAYRMTYLMWAIGMLVWGIGLIIWSYYNLILKVGVPFPSIADICFIVYYGFMGYGTLRLQQISNDKNQLPILASLPVTIISFVMVLFVFNRPDLSTAVPIVQRVISVGYSLGDALLLSMVLVAIQNAVGSRVRRAILFIISSFVVMLIADFTFFYGTARGSYYNGNISDVLYGLFPTLLIVAMMQLYITITTRQPSAQSLASDTPDAENPTPPPPPGTTITL